MKKFSDFLAELETTDQIQKIELMNPAGEIVGLIENKPGIARYLPATTRAFGSTSANFRATWATRAPTRHHYALDQ